MKLSHYRIALQRAASFVAVLVLAAPLAASATSVQGYFNDPSNGNLLSSYGYNDIEAPQFGSVNDIADNFAIYQLNVNRAVTIEFQSTGYAAGGALPYFSIFTGSDATATFLDSTYDDPSYNGPVSDFDKFETLATGTYLFTIGVYEDMSFADQDYPAIEPLSEGFTGLGDPSVLGNSFYQIVFFSNVNTSPTDPRPFTISPVASSIVTTAPPPASNDVPEPAVPALLGIGIVALGARRLRGKRKA